MAGADTDNPSPAGAGYVGGAAADSAARDSMIASLEGRPVGRVTIAPRNIYEPVPPGAIGHLFRIANRLHMRTRPSTIRALLLFDEGDPWSDELGRETARLMRSLDFLYPQRIEALPAGDSVEVLVETRDVWSTRLEFNLESFAGRSYGSIALNELNFLGFGKSVSLTYREEPSGRADLDTIGAAPADGLRNAISRSFAFHDPNVMGSRLRLRTLSSTGTNGSSDQFFIGVPFYSEDAQRAFGLQYLREGAIVQLYQRSAVVAELDKRLQQGELFYGFGARREGVVERLEFSLFAMDRELGATRLSEAASPGFIDDAESQQVRRVAVEGRLWRPRFVERSYVNRLGFTEDFDVGSSFTMKLGFSPRAFGGTASEGYAQMKLDAGAQAGAGFGWLRTSVSGRIRREPREVLATVDAAWVHQPRPRQAWVFAARGVSGSRMAHDFQTGVGGLTGLRAYPVRAVSGRRLWRFNAESRLTVAHGYDDVLTIGWVGFADAARAWGTGSEGSTWHYSLGTGLRFNLPLWSQSRVLRVDVAWPISPTRDGKREPVFSFGSGQAF